MQFHNPGHDRFGRYDRCVLADGDGGAERWLVGLVACGFDAFGRQCAAAVVVLQLVPFERFGVGLIVAAAI
ncbi:hypothetical protein D3C71_2101780 [compost metagenome]